MERKNVTETMADQVRAVAEVIKAEFPLLAENLQADVLARIVKVEIRA